MPGRDGTISAARRHPPHFIAFANVVSFVYICNLATKVLGKNYILVKLLFFTFSIHCQKEPCSTVYLLAVKTAASGSDILHGGPPGLALALGCVEER